MKSGSRTTLKAKTRSSKATKYIAEMRFFACTLLVISVFSTAEKSTLAFQATSTITQVVARAPTTRSNRPSLPRAVEVEQQQPKGSINAKTVTASTVPKPIVDTTLAKTASVAAATVLTYFLNNQLALGPVQASGLVALLSSIVLPERLALAALCGSFAGMAKTAVVPSMGAAALLGCLCAGTLNLFDRKGWLVGAGGRLGFIAQIACTLQFVLWQHNLVQRIATGSLGLTAPSAALAKLSLYKMSASSIVAQLPSLMFFTAAGAFFMRAWKNLLANTSKRLSTSTAAVGATGLLASLCLPASAAGPAFVGSFVAMSSPATLPRSQSMVVATSLAGICQIGLTGVLLGGWGGKMGTAALLGVLSYKLTKKAVPTAKLAIE